MKIIITILVSLIITACASHPGSNLPSSQAFYHHSVSEIQDELISAYLASDQGWSIKGQSKNSITFTRVDDGMSGIFMQTAVSGSNGSLPIIDVQFAFANTSNSIRVFPKVKIINTNGFGRQGISNVKNPAGAKATIRNIKNKLEPLASQ